MAAADRTVEQIASEQHGLVTRTQAVEAELSSRQIRRRVESGAWKSADSGVYRMAGAPETWHSRVLAVCLATGGMASHWTAGHLWKLGATPGNRIHIVVPSGACRHREDVFVHQYSQFHQVTRRSADGIPVTAPTVTAMDLSGMNDLARSTSFVDAGRRLGLFDWTDLLRTLIDLARRGRNGSANLRAILNMHFGELAIPDSSFNRAVATAVELAGLPAPTPEYWFTLPSGRRVRMDLAWPHAQVAVELQSSYHLNSTTLRRDAEKAVGAHLRGWTVLPFTVEQWRSDPVGVVADIASALRNAARLVEFASPGAA